MEDLSRIRLRPDGSIDTAWYMMRGRRLRGEQAYRLMGADLDTRPRRTPRPRNLLARLIG